jgi:hypothetical protein
MERYKNLSGNSGVYAFEIGSSSIIVQFESGDVYEYDYYKPGTQHVREMQRLALLGRGLGTYINKYVGKNFRRKY